MCAVSMIGDGFKKNWPDNPNNPWQIDQLLPSYPKPLGPNQTSIFSPVSQQEFDALKKEVQELRKLLEAAKEYDDAAGQKDCEMEEKVDFIKKLAAFVGVDLDHVFTNKG